MAISTYQTYLMYGTGTSTITWTKLCDIKDIPDLVGLPEQIEVTTLSDPEREYIPGLRSNDQKTFTANYDSDVYDTIEAMAGTEMPLAVWFGASTAGGVDTPDGSNGKFEGKGYVNMAKPGGGVNDPHDMQVVLTMTQGFRKVAG